MEQQLKFAKFRTLQKESVSADSFVFCYGRFQPPSAGHQVLIDKVLNLSEYCDYSIFLSPTHDTKKNPLLFEQKLGFMQEMFPGTNISSRSDFKSVWDVLKHLSENTTYKHITMVAGGDRVQKYQSEFTKYLNHPDPAKRLNFETFTVINAGDRDPDSDDASGVSGSAMREAAIDGNATKFIEMTPRHFKDGFKMMNEVRTGMNLPILFENPTITFFRRKEPPMQATIETQDPGLYSGYHLNRDSAHLLYNWAQSQGIQNVVLPEKMHCTVVWSTTSVPDYKLGPFEEIAIKPEDYLHLDNFGGVLVLRFHKDELQSKWQYAKALGATPTYPTYEQHITLSYAPEDSLEKAVALPVPDFTITLDKEFRETAINPMFTEMYDEPDDSTFSDNNHEYDLNGLLSATMGMVVQEFDVNKLKWILRWDPPVDSKRVFDADLNAPILIINSGPRLVVVDGIHRLAKAVEENKPTIKGIIVPDELMQRYENK